MTKTILAFGDSNTFGTPPMDSAAAGPLRRYDSETRWPGVVAARTGWTVVEQGLPGRTATALPDPVMGAHMNGPLGLNIALNSCGPIDGLVLMLGTNDQKTMFGLDADGITGAIAGLIAMIKSEDVQAKHGGFETLLICPPAVHETGVLKEKYFGAADKSARLPDRLAALADRWDIDYFNANTVITTSDVDGVHFDEASHKTLGTVIAKALLTSLV